MARHIFLTGEKQVGKSTLLRKVLERYAGNPGGFLTVRTDEYLKDRYSVHIFRLEDRKVPEENNMLFECGKYDDTTSDRFDRLGCAILSECGGYSLIVMDELGPHEADAALFRAAVLKLLDGSTPILGVLQAPCELFWPDIANRPDVKVITINESNRDDAQVVEGILSVLTSACI